MIRSVSPSSFYSASDSFGSSSFDPNLSFCDASSCDPSAFDLGGASDIAMHSLTLRVHPWRSALYEELHDSPSPVIESACQIVHFTVQFKDSKAAVYEHVVDLCRRFSVPVPKDDSSCLYMDFGGFELRWKRHLEFANFTFMFPLGEPFSKDAMGFIPQDWLAALPGEVVVALRMVLLDREPSTEELKLWFEGQRWNSSNVAAGKAQAWTAFKLHSDGFGRILACDQSLSPYQRGRLVQRLVEIESYRLMALLALPVARELSPVISKIENDLARLNHSIAEPENEGNERLLLNALSQLAAEIEQHRSDTNFRFAATKAYYDLVLDRLKQLHESPIHGAQTLQKFLHRRLGPGINTCLSVRDRLEDLSRRLHRTSSLLRTQVELSIEEQNHSLLMSMNRRAHLQLRLQTAVEGLSVVVVSYYVLALLGMALNAYAGMLGLTIDKDTVLGVAMPGVLLGVYWGVHRVRRSLGGVGGRHSPRSSA